MVALDRFEGVQTLYQEEAKAFAVSRFILVGLGGVGSWVAEALVRTGVVNLTLIDPDTVALTNTNRQLQALEGSYGKTKIKALAERFEAINPQVRLTLIEEFVTKENVEEFLSAGAIVIDCIDEVKSKAALLAAAQKLGCRVLTAGGAGGRKDPLKMKVLDLARVTGDPLLASVRHALRHDYNYPKGDKKAKPFGITAVYTDEALQHAPVSETKLAVKTQRKSYGTAVTVVATMGMTLAALALEAAAED